MSVLYGAAAVAKAQCCWHCSITMEGTFANLSVFLFVCVCVYLKKKCAQVKERVFHFIIVCVFFFYVSLYDGCCKVNIVLNKSEQKTITHTYDANGLHFFASGCKIFGKGFFYNMRL